MRAQDPELPLSPSTDAPLGLPVGVDGRALPQGELTPVCPCRRSSWWCSLGRSMWSASGQQAAAASMWASGGGCVLPGSPFPSSVSHAGPHGSLMPRFPGQGWAPPQEGQIWWGGPPYRTSSRFPQSTVPATGQDSKAIGATSQVPQHRSQPQWSGPLPPDTTHRTGVLVTLGTVCVSAAPSNLRAGAREVASGGLRTGPRQRAGSPK